MRKTIFFLIFPNQDITLATKCGGIVIRIDIVRSEALLLFQTDNKTG